MNVTGMPAIESNATKSLVNQSKQPTCLLRVSLSYHKGQSIASSGKSTNAEGTVTQMSPALICSIILSECSPPVQAISCRWYESPTSNQSLDHKRQFNLPSFAKHSPPSVNATAGSLHACNSPLLVVAGCSPHRQSKHPQAAGGQQQRGAGARGKHRVSGDEAWPGDPVPAQEAGLCAPGHEPWSAPGSGICLWTDRHLLVRFPFTLLFCFLLLVLSSFLIPAPVLLLLLPHLHACQFTWMKLSGSAALPADPPGMELLAELHKC